MFSDTFMCPCTAVAVHPLFMWLYAMNPRSPRSRAKEAQGRPWGSPRGSPWGALGGSTGGSPGETVWLDPLGGPLGCVPASFYMCRHCCDALSMFPD